MAQILSAGTAIDVRIELVWTRMLPGDDLAAARQSAAPLFDPRVRHFYDPHRNAGRAFATHVFADRWRQARAHLPEGHRLRTTIDRAAAKPAGDAPLWDAALWFPADVEWGEGAPEPTAFAKQIEFRSRREPKGTFWRDGFDRPPIESSWRAELARLLRAAPPPNGK